MPYPNNAECLARRRKVSVFVSYWFYSAGYQTIHILHAGLALLGHSAGRNSLTDWQPTAADMCSEYKRGLVYRLPLHFYSVIATRVILTKQYYQWITQDEKHTMYSNHPVITRLGRSMQGDHDTFVLYKFGVHLAELPLKSRSTDSLRYIRIRVLDYLGNIV